MPSPRRLRLLVLAALAITVMILYYTSKLDDQAGRDGRTIQDFYHKTVNAMEGKLAPAQAMLDKTGSKAGKVPADRDGDGDVDADDEESAIKMQERLKAAEQKAKDKANEKGGLRPDPPSKMVGVGSSAEGQKKGVGKGKSAQEVAEEIQEPKSEDELKAEKELNAILKRSPGKPPCMYVPSHPLADAYQSSSSPNLIAHSQSAPRVFCLRNTLSRLIPMSSSLMSILRVPSCKTS